MSVERILFLKFIGILKFGKKLWILRIFKIRKNSNSQSMPVTKEYNMILVKRRWCSVAGKVTGSLAESNGSLPLLDDRHLQADCLETGISLSTKPRQKQMTALTAKMWLWFYALVYLEPPVRSVAGNSYVPFVLFLTQRGWMSRHKSPKLIEFGWVKFVVTYASHVVRYVSDSVLKVRRTNSLFSCWRCNTI